LRIEQMTTGEAPFNDTRVLDKPRDPSNKLGRDALSGDETGEGGTTGSAFRTTMFSNGGLITRRGKSPVL
jgi:hypothetical protein